jgi:hypothetical protein
MLVHRVRRGGIAPTTLERVTALAGLGDPAFFVSADGVNTGNNTWLDAAGARVGTFENAGYSVLQEYGRKFVRLSSCRCVFTTDVFASTDTAIVVLASVRPTTGVAANRMMASQPRTTSATYGWYLQFNTAHTLTHYTYHGGSADTTVLSRALPRAGHWGIVTAAKYAYPAEAYDEFATPRIRSLSRVFADSYSADMAALAPQTAASLPFLIGGGRSSTGTIAAPFYGDIEWFGIWKVRCSPDQLVEVEERLRLDMPNVAGFGTPPKRAPARTVYVNPDLAHLRPDGTAVPAYSGSVTYAAGDTVIAPVNGASGYAKVEMLGLRTSSTFSTSTQPSAGNQLLAVGGLGGYLARVVDGSFTDPAAETLSASYQLKSGDTLAVNTGDGLPARTAYYGNNEVDGGLPPRPPAVYAPHLGRKSVKVRSYDLPTGAVARGAVHGGFTLRSGVFSVSGFSYVGATTITQERLSIDAVAALAYVDRATLTGSLHASKGTVYAHTIESRGLTAYDNRGGAALPGTDTYNANIRRLLSNGPTSKYSCLSTLGGALDVGYSKLSHFSVLSVIRTGVISVANSSVYHSMPYTAVQGASVTYLPVVDTEAPGGASLEWVGGSTPENSMPTYASQVADPSNKERALPYVSVRVIAADTQNTGVGATHRLQGWETTATYKADIVTDLGRPPFAYETRFGANAGSTVAKANDPFRSRSYVELYADIRDPGAKIFEIDFILDTTSNARVLDPRGFMSLAVFYYDAAGNFQAYRDAPQRSGLEYDWSAAYTLTQKVTSSTWVTPDNSVVCGSRTLSLPSVGRGRVRLRVNLIGVAQVTINPVVKVV